MCSAMARWVEVPQPAHDDARRAGYRACSARAATTGPARGHDATTLQLDAGLRIRQRTLWERRGGGMVEPPQRRVRFVVDGRVQGVGFRAQTQRRARELGLVGFVRNRADGRVEGEAEGPAAQVDALLEWLQRGPAWAHVEQVDVDELPPAGGEAAFEVRR